MVSLLLFVLTACGSGDSDTRNDKKVDLRKDRKHITTVLLKFYSDNGYNVTFPEQDDENWVVIIKDGNSIVSARVNEDGSEDTIHITVIMSITKKDDIIHYATLGNKIIKDDGTIEN